MSRGPGRPFQKGVSPNPAGRPVEAPDIKQARALTKAAFLSLLNKYIFHTEDELEAISGDRTVPAIDKMVIAIIRKGITDADTVRLNFLAERLVGKVENAPQDYNFNFQMLPREQVIELGKEAIRYLEGNKEE